MAAEDGPNNTKRRGVDRGKITPHTGVSTKRTTTTRISSMSGNHNPPSSSYPELNYGSGAKWIKNLTQNRLGTFTGGHFSDVNLSSVLYTHRTDGKESVRLQV